MAVKYLNLTVNNCSVARVDVTELSIQGTWIDGYLPSVEKMRQLAQKYRHLDTDKHGLPLEYGFSQASDVWLQEDYFGAIAAAIRTKFDYENLSPDVRPTPCCMWLMQINKEPSDRTVLPLYHEYSADPRKEDYYHLITIHDECPVAEGCLQQVVRDLCFEPKPKTAYTDQIGFVGSVHEILTRHVRTLASPCLEVERQLDSISDNVVSGGP